ncbi:SLAM family member 5-like isoform X3 [Amia ocellicauda]|uniref:SLAM family member 5-like isoform X3 n=1 Tax=Amia ocellicauda TaxID=2972642 RepID=UPI0034645592
MGCRRGGQCLLTALCLWGLCPSPIQSEEKLKGTVGMVITFPTPVLKDGSLQYKGIGSIARVFSGQSRTDYVERFKGRVTWDNSTGLFSITHLDMSDTGEYTVEINEGNNQLKHFPLTVYDRVSKPQVNNSQTRTESDMQTCTLLCSVANGIEVTLSWYREGEEKPLNHSSSPDLSTPLTLPLETEGLFHSYSCVATNPVSNETVRATAGQYCQNTAAHDTSRRYNIVYAVVFSTAGVLLVIGLITYLRRRRHRHREGPPSSLGSTVTEPLYTEVSHRHRNTERLTQGSQQQDLSELVPSGHPDTPLTTVYDEIRPREQGEC